MEIKVPFYRIVKPMLGDDNKFYVVAFILSWDDFRLKEPRAVLTNTVSEN